MFLFAGNCVIENEETTLATAQKLKELCAGRVDLVYKTSFHKANRTNINSYTGPDYDTARRALSWVRDLGLEIITDVHTDLDVDVYGPMVDFLQIPAFLCRQTELIKKAADTGKPLLIKKGQFLDPYATKYIVDKIPGADVFLCERGTTFGYNDLIVDMRALKIMRRYAPVVFDATHCVQKPGGATTDGAREFIPDLLRAAIAVGVDGVFIETHPDPVNALSDAATQWPLDKMEELLDIITA